MKNDWSVCLWSLFKSGLLISKLTLLNKEATVQTRLEVPALTMAAAASCHMARNAVFT